MLNIKWKGTGAGMKDFIKINEFDFTLNRDTVFDLIDCYPGNSVYEDVAQEYQGIEIEAKQVIKPQAFLKFGTISEKAADKIEGIEAGSFVIYVLMTIGDEITELCSGYFAKGDYLLGMLVNAISDTYLFQMDASLKDKIMESTIARHKGISGRLDAPVNMPMSVQEDILEEIKEIEELPIGVTEGFMYTTVKTMGYILVLTDDEQAIYSGHNCNVCTAKNCKLRKN